MNKKHLAASSFVLVTAFYSSFELANGTGQFNQTSGPQHRSAAAAGKPSDTRQDEEVQQPDVR